MDNNSKILITGGTGFLGQALIRILHEKGFWKVSPCGRSDADLMSFESTCHLVSTLQPDTVFHLAATVGGIGANRKSPGSFWLENTVMGANLLRACVDFKVKQIVLVGTTCSYPKNCSVPFQEEDLWNGFPEETNAPYGIAKKNLVMGAMALAQQYEIDVRLPIPTNLYGPGDHYSLEDSHVIPAMIMKFQKAKAKEEEKVVLWGDGSPTRDFLYVDDAAKGLIVIATKDSANGVPVNLGSGKEVQMKTLAHLIQNIVGYKGLVNWDLSKPNGQPRRKLDTSRANKLLGWHSETSFEEGLKKTYQDYISRMELGLI